MIVKRFEQGLYTIDMSLKYSLVALHCHWKGVESCHQEGVESRHEEGVQSLHQEGVRSCHQEGWRAVTRRGWRAVTRVICFKSLASFAPSDVTLFCHAASVERRFVHLHVVSDVLTTLPV